MKKIFAGLIMVLLIAGPALADNHYNNTYYNDPVTINQNPTATATATGGAGGTATIQSGAVQNKNENNIGNGLNNFSPSASAKIEKGAVQNTNTNVGINTNKNFQAQMQGQLQGQLQGQIANNNQTIAPEQSVTIINPENKRDLPNIPGYVAPQQLEFRGPYEKGVAGKVKPWVRSTLWDKKSLEGMASMFGNASCKEYPIAKKSEATETLNVKESKEPAVAYYECAGDSDFELWGEVGTKALAAGAMTIEELAYAVTYYNKSTGWNIGFGGGVTAINGGNDNYGASVGGGTGFGSATSEPKAKITAIFIAR